MEYAGGVVLAGGRSRRMGSSKAALEWHGSTLLRRTVGVVRRAVDGPVLVVAAPGQVLPELPADVAVFRDPAPALGPLQGIAVGLAELSCRAEVAFVCATDLPHLHHRLVSTVLARLREDGSARAAEAAVPVIAGRPQPLAAAYRTRLAAAAQDLVTAGRLRAGDLAQVAATLWLDEEDLLTDHALAAVDPALASLRDIDSPEAYRAARSAPAPIVTVLQEHSQDVSAATLGAALAAVGRALDYRVVPHIEGIPQTRDEQFPLCAGDCVTLAPLATVTGQGGLASGRMS